jgi:hypothetical protein
MSIGSQLRAQARRFRELAYERPGDIAVDLREVADRLERRAAGLEAYAATTRLTARHTLTTSV